MSDLWQPLRLSLAIALCATALAALSALPLACVCARKSFAGKSAVEALLIIPLVLPPTVVGFILILLFGVRGYIGIWLVRWFDYSITFRFEGAVLAAVVVAFPLIYLPAKAGFASISRDHFDLARVLGASRTQLFWHVALPLARKPIASGLLLGFARALGEFGATMMVFGWRDHHLTLPISVYADYEQDNFHHATPALAVLLVISLIVSLLFNGRFIIRGNSTY